MHTRSTARARSSGIKHTDFEIWLIYGLHLLDTAYTRKCKDGLPEEGPDPLVSVRRN